MRQSWDEYFLDLAFHAATRATCSRRKVGAVVVQDRKVRSTGYNGGPSGFPHCDEGACPRGRSSAQVRSAEADRVLSGSYDDCIAIHAEANAIMQSDPRDRVGATIYCTDFPCFQCAKLIANSGVSRVVYKIFPETEASEKCYSFLEKCGLSMTHLQEQ